MQTLHTKIISGEINFNSPSSYKVIHKTTGEVAQTINIQKGPVKENGLNGIFIEDLLLICIDQLEHFQASQFKCKENEATLRHLNDALATTRARQYERYLRDVQGKNLK
ncbi:hypothetical protein [Clostridium haemolyticum]|uniref:Acb2/Tad1 hairpin domain-containing protein n=1 Tax=Clostridium haemolyticum NCTC 9693 TaxID=1443114 RepID=A0ABR4TJP5_CLOHA|nr:hypothetical protein [Clostridium haemolyticum]KEI18260.1 hypothetical protein Z960_03865 [Clostridium haemolyticum NCTC 9693]KGN04185.1 hypothetical protein Z961_04350 [Clostridium haemolyticum NCTC 8350]